MDFPAAPYVTPNSITLNGVIRQTRFTPIGVTLNGVKQIQSVRSFCHLQTWWNETRDSVILALSS